MYIKNIRLFRIFIVAVLVSLLFCDTFVYASDRKSVDSVIYVGENKTELLSICSQANNKVDSKILKYTGNDGLLSFSNEKYTELTVNDREEFMEVALLATKESGLGDRIKNKVYNFIAEQDSTTSAAVKFLRSDASADFVEASSWFKPFGSVAGVVLGFLSLVIFMFIALSIVFDLAYMSLPGFRVVLDRGEKRRPRWVSREAYSAVIDSENSINDNYKGHMSLYFQRRVPSILLMAIALGYLISGQIYDIIVFFIDSFSWIFEQ